MPTASTTPPTCPASWRRPGRTDALVLGPADLRRHRPGSRRRGRLFTRFWTDLETGGRVIEDPLCGFRVYPLEAALRAGARGDRMDFDVEIAVRLVWAGCPVVNLPTQVRYLTPGEGGVSHFQMWRDNALISWAHTRLCAGALLRLATGRRLRRGTGEAARAGRTCREKGTAWASRWWSVARLLGRRAAGWVIAVRGRLVRPVPPGRAAGLARVPPPRRVRAGLREVIPPRLHLRAGERWTGSSWCGARSGGSGSPPRRGAPVAAARRAARCAHHLAHMGSFEILRALSRERAAARERPGVLPERAEAQRRPPAHRTRPSTRSSSRSGPTTRASSSRSRTGSGGARWSGPWETGSGFDGKSVRAPFLGAEASFPTGPYLLAAALRCPVFLAFGLYRAPDRYELYCEPFAEQIVAAARPRARAGAPGLVARYAARARALLPPAPTTGSTSTTSGAWHDLEPRRVPSILRWAAAPHHRGRAGPRPGAAVRPGGSRSGGRAGGSAPRAAALERRARCRRDHLRRDHRVRRVVRDRGARRLPPSWPPTSCGSTAAGRGARSTTRRRRR